MLDRLLSTAAESPILTTRVVVIDIETCGRLNLKRVGHDLYARDPSTHVRVVGYAIGDAPARQWVPGEKPPPQELVAAARDPHCMFIAHGASFEIAICRHILSRFGLPEIPIERWRCTMARARALALPASLGDLAAVLNLKNQKDAAGARVMAALAKPRKPRAGEDPKGIYFDEDPKKFAVLCRYNLADVEATRELDRVLPPLSGDEQRLWAFTETINYRGFYIDRAFSEAAKQVVEAARPEIDAEICRLTNGKTRRATEVASLCRSLEECGLTIASLNKKAVTALLATDDLSPLARQLLELRLDGGVSSPAKFDAFLAGAGEDDRYRGAFIYHGAATGRWTAQGAQPQNFPRLEGEEDDLEQQVALVATGDYQQVRARYSNPIAIVKNCLRPTIIAAPKHVLFGGDLTTIEPRVLSLLAGERQALEDFRAFDAGTGHDIYVLTYARTFGVKPEQVDKAQRFVGKIMVLALGYGGGLGAWRKFDTSGRFSDQEIEVFKLNWRRTHQPTVRFWSALDRAAWNAVKHRGVVFPCGAVSFECTDAFLFLRLPSGREVAYPHPRLLPDERGRTVVTFKNNAAGQWRDERAWGGFWAENVVQAFSRDLLATSMLRIEAANYPIVLTIHDEVIAELADGFGSLEEFHQLITTVPPWAGALPVEAKVWSGPRYTK